MEASRWNAAVHRGFPSRRHVAVHGHGPGVKATRREWATGGVAILLGSATAKAEEEVMITRKVGGNYSYDSRF